MTNITLELTPSQFLVLFGENPDVRHFSEDAVEVILDYIEVDEEWPSYFQNAEEYTTEALARTLCERYPKNYTVELLDIARQLDIDLPEVPCDCEEKEFCSCEEEDLILSAVDANYKLLSNEQFQYRVIDFFRDCDCFDGIQLPNCDWLEFNTHNERF